MTMKTIILASNNAHKVAEFQKLFAPCGIEILSLKSMQINIDVEETGATFAENAILKAEAIAALTQLPVLADDSGLEVDVLNGAPGVYSARYAGIHGDDAANNAKLLYELIETPLEARTAQFVCAIAYAKPNEKTQVFSGVCKGHIALNTDKEGGFGYDPLFVPAGYSQTFAELGSDVKNTMSHRAKAFELLIQSFS